MRSLSILFTLILVLQVHAKPAQEEGLPFEPDTTKVELRPIGRGQELNLDFFLTLPKSQQLNKGAPSYVSVFERNKGEKWTLTHKEDLNKIFTIDESVRFSKAVKLRYSDSDVAVFSTVFHCGKDKSRCQIQGFQGITSRGPANLSRNTIPFYIEGKMK